MSRSEEKMRRGTSNNIRGDDKVHLHISWAVVRRLPFTLPTTHLRRMTSPSVANATVTRMLPGKIDVTSKTLSSIFSTAPMNANRATRKSAMRLPSLPRTVSKSPSSAKDVSNVKFDCGAGEVVAIVDVAPAVVELLLVSPVVADAVLLKGKVVTLATVVASVALPPVVGADVGLMLTLGSGVVSSKVEDAGVVDVSAVSPVELRADEASRVV